jgi:hypothetical protein
MAWWAADCYCTACRSGGGFDLVKYYLDRFGSHQDFVYTIQNGLKLEIFGSLLNSLQIGYHI